MKGKRVTQFENLTGEIFHQIQSQFFTGGTVGDACHRMTFQPLPPPPQPQAVEFFTE